MIEIGKLFNIEKGSLQSSKCTPGQYSFITAGEEWKTHIEYTHDCEALVFAMAASGSLGRTHYVNGKFIASDLCFILTPKKEYVSKVNLRFYSFYFNTYRERIVKATATGTSKLAINRKSFSNYQIYLVDIERQNQLLHKLDKMKSISDWLFQTIQQQQKYAEMLRQSILQQAVEGKLCEQDPNDEPASVLLEKIKAEKERLIAEKKIKKQKPLLFDDGKGFLVFVEFKNGFMDRPKQFAVRKKVYDSALIFTDITSKGISYMRNHMKYILVYNETANQGNNSDKDLKEKQKTAVQQSPAFDAFAKNVGKYANEEYVCFGLKIFQNYCFKEVHTYTEAEFDAYLSTL